MKIENLRITNFRCVQSAAVDIRALTAFVGRNGAGKSTFLQALQLFYGSTDVVTDEDFYAKNTSEDITIEVTFGCLRPEERAEFAPYISGDTLTVTKKFSAPATGSKVTQGRYYATAKTFPGFAAVREASAASDKKNAYNALITDGTLPPGTGKPKTMADVEDAMAAFEAEHPELLKPIVRETQMFGEKNVGSGKLDKYTRFVYIPAVRDVTDEAEDRKASFAQLFDLIVTPKVQARPEVQQLEGNISALVGTAYDERFIGPDLDSLASDLNTVLEPLVGDARISFRIIPPEVKVPAPRIQPVVTEDHFAGDLSRKGHGLQRAIIFTVLSHLARVRTAASGAETQPDLILAIEEPELYQHPTRCRQIQTVLRNLSATAMPGNQVILSTHSPYFLDIEHYEDVRIVRKQMRECDVAAATEVTKLSFEAIRDDWARCCALDPSKVTKTTLSARLRKPFLTAASEGFFADVVVLVEGSGDAALLSRVAERKRVDWAALGLVVIPTNGKANLGAPWLVFRTLGIPTYVVFDGDVQHRGAKPDIEKASIKHNEFLQLAGGVESPVPFPVTCAGSTFSCQEGELESECKIALDEKAWDDARTAAAGEVDCNVTEVLNNATATALFVDHVYDNGHSLPFAEKIVDAITAFASAGGVVKIAGFAEVA